MAEGMTMGKSLEFTVGSGDFVNAVLKEVEEKTNLLAAAVEEK